MARGLLPVVRARASTPPAQEVGERGRQRECVETGRAHALREPLGVGGVAPRARRPLLRELQGMEGRGGRLKLPAALHQRTPRARCAGHFGRGRWRGSVPRSRLRCGARRARRERAVSGVLLRRGKCRETRPAARSRMSRRSSPSSRSGMSSGSARLLACTTHWLRGCRPLTGCSAQQRDGGWERAEGEQES